jgi:hypothetical protein
MASRRKSAIALAEASRGPWTSEGDVGRLKHLATKNPRQNVVVTMRTTPCRHGVVLIMTLAVGARRGTARRNLPARETCESREIKREIAALDPARRGNRDLIAGMPGLHTVAASSSHV